MADAPILATMNQETVGKALAATLYVSRTADRPEERKAAECAARWCLSVLEGIPPLEDFTIPEDEKAAIAEALKGIRFENTDLDEARQWIIKALERPDEPKPPTPPTHEIAPPLPHATDFLSAGVRTHPYAGYTPEQRQKIRDAMTSRHYPHIYVYAYNEKDYGGPAFDGLRNPQAFRGMLEELRAVGLAPVVWCFPDDAPTLHALSTSALQSLLSGFVPVVDDLVSSWVLGLELDEYWDDGKINALGKHLRGLTMKKIASHQTSGNFDIARGSWVDYCIFQYGKGKTTSQISSMTKACIAAIHKPVVAGEYELSHEPTAIKLGDAAVAAGATGFGNGGTPPSRPAPPPETGTGLDSPNLLAGSPRPWVPGSLVTIDAAWPGNLLAFCDASPNTQIILADMSQIPARMREAGFHGRDTALWFTLSRSYAGWNWHLDANDPDRHLSAQRTELRDFWTHYLDVILTVMRARTAVRALFLLNDNHHSCGDVLSEYSLRQLSSVASRIDRGQVYAGALRATREFPPSEDEEVHP